jgi:predicted amidophosphoribosyltransferase
MRMTSPPLANQIGLAVFDMVPWSWYKLRTCLGGDLHQEIPTLNFTCPACHGVMEATLESDTRIVCSHCQTRLHESHPQPPAPLGPSPLTSVRNDLSACQNCGEPVTATDRHCPGCEEPLDAAVSAARSARKSRIDQRFD